MEFRNTARNKLLPHPSQLNTSPETGFFVDPLICLGLVGFFFVILPRADLGLQSRKPLVDPHE